MQVAEDHLEQQLRDGVAPGLPKLSGVAGRGRFPAGSGIGGAARMLMLFFLTRCSRMVVVLPWKESCFLHTSHPTSASHSLLQ